MEKQTLNPDLNRYRRTYFAKHPEIQKRYRLNSAVSILHRNGFKVIPPQGYTIVNNAVIPSEKVVNGND